MKKIDLQIGSYTSVCPITISPQDTCQFALDITKARGIRHFPVVEDKRVVGIVSQRDLNVAHSFEPLTKIEQVMSKDPYCVKKTAQMGKVALEMSARKIGSAIVSEENGTLYGIFTVTDALNCLVEVLRGDLDEYSMGDPEVVNGVKVGEQQANP